MLCYKKKYEVGIERIIRCFKKKKKIECIYLFLSHVNFDVFSATSRRKQKKHVQEKPPRQV